MPKKHKRLQDLLCFDVDALQTLLRCILSQWNFCPDGFFLSYSSAISAQNRMAKSETEEMIEIEIDEREKQACLEEG